MRRQHPRPAVRTPPAVRPSSTTRPPAPTHRADPTGEAARRERRAAARAQGVMELLQRRPDLAGVHGPADLTAEAVRWSA